MTLCSFLERIPTDSIDLLEQFNTYVKVGFLINCQMFGNKLFLGILRQLSVQFYDLLLLIRSLLILNKYS